MTLKQFLHNKNMKRMVIFGLLVVILFLLRSMINLILFTFILTYLMNRLQSFITKKIGSKVNPKVIVIVLYLLMLLGIGAALYNYLPVITKQITNLIYEIRGLYINPPQSEVSTYIFSVLNDLELTSYINESFDILSRSITDVSGVALQFFLSFILSLFFLLEKQRIITFTAKFKESKLVDFYTEIEYFGKKFTGSFGKVIEAQFIIALVNCGLTTIALWILGFPQLVALSTMIFFLGLIPVAGVIISLVPLLIIGYNIGSSTYVLYILLIIIATHILESYVLNPKVMSAKTNLPVFYTFIVLIFSEHFFGVWGLIIGIPIFMFLLDVLEVFSEKDVLQ